MLRSVVLSALVALAFTLLIVSFTVSQAKVGGVLLFSAATNAPCDIVTCAEAYSVTRQMKSGYSGPLFQIYNGTTTLDIGQAADHRADMTTWSAFCSGVQSNCKITKIYAQIHTTSNDLASGQGIGACGFGIAACAAPFKIEAATGLPRLDTTTGQEYVIDAFNDAASTGINSGTNALSVAMNFQVQQIAKCCGSFGMDHLFNAGNVAGTDFQLGQSYGTGNGSTTGFCANSTAYCLTMDEEGLSGGPNVVASITAGNNAFWIGTYAGSGTNNQTGYYNGTQIWNLSPTGLNPGLRIHLGGGGDLTQPADTILREALITNSQLSQANATALQTNETTFYSGLTFP